MQARKLNTMSMEQHVIPAPSLPQVACRSPQLAKIAAVSVNTDHKASTPQQTKHTANFNFGGIAG